MSLDGLRRGAQRVQTGSTQQKKGNKGGYWLRFKAPKLTQELYSKLRPNEPPGDPVIIHEGKYVDPFVLDPSGKPTTQPCKHVFMHVVKRSKDGKDYTDDFVCSAGANPHAPCACNGCSEVDAGNKSVSQARQYFAFNIDHLVFYHRVPVKDKQTGQMVMRDGKQVTYLDQCRIGTPAMRAAYPKGCEHCQAGLPLQFGASRILHVGKEHLNAILQRDRQVQRMCRNCGTGLVITGYDCEKCNGMILDIAQSGFTNEQIEVFEQTAFQCRCGHQGLPRRIYDCGYDPSGMQKLPNAGCPESVEPAPVQLSDVVLWLHREGVDAQTKLVASEPVPKAYFRTPDGRPLDDILKEVSKPFDLEKLYAETPLDRQAEIMNTQNRYASQQPAFQPYPGQGQMPQGQPGYQQQQQQLPMGYPQQPNQQQAQQPVFPAQPYPGSPFPGRPDFGK